MLHDSPMVYLIVIAGAIFIVWALTQALAHQR